MNLVARTIPELLLEGRTHEQITRELYALDQRVFPGMAIEHAGVPEVWVELLRRHEPNYRVLVSGEKLVGYWHVAPLTEATMERLLKGALPDGEIEPEDIQSLDRPGEYDLYFLVVATEPGFRGRRIIPLAQAFHDYLVKLAESGCFFRRLCANAFSPEGERFCRRAGMVLCHDRDSGGRTFCFDGTRLIEWTKNTSPRLGDLYSRHFGVGL